MRPLPALLGFALAALVAAGSTPEVRAQATSPGTTTPADSTATDTQTPVATEAPAQPAAAWPCEQPERPEISLGSVWQGPDPSAAEATWRGIPAVEALVSQVGPRRLPQDEAVAAIHRFAAGYADEKDRSAMLIQVFAGLFDTMGKERGEIIRGIRHFNHRQDALSQRIEAGWKAIDALDPNSTDPAVAQQRIGLQEAIDWDSRIFDDRQRLLPEICQQPIVIEQRLYALARAVQQDLGPAP